MTNDEITAELMETIREYEPDALPSSITRTIYVGYGVGEHNRGQITLRDKEYEGNSFATVLLTKQTITFKLPKAKIDVRAKLLHVYEREKQEILAEHHMRLGAVQEKIDRLLALEHHATGA